VCDSCRDHRPPDECTGWVVIVPRERPIALRTLTYHERALQIEIEARCDFRRPKQGAGDDWRATPTRATDLAVMIYDAKAGGAKEERLLERHHVDLGNPGQHGPVWHLQFGGNPPGDAKLPTGWLDPPRWPIPPTDLTLFVEAIIYNFDYEAWKRLWNSGAWRSIVQQAEDLMLIAYAEELERHFNRPPRLRPHSWLAVLDNQRAPALWDPRPT